MSRVKTRETVENRFNTTEETVEQLLFTEVTELNGHETEEELNMAIVKELMHEKLSEESFKKSVEELKSEIDKEANIKNGVFVFVDGDTYSWKYDRYDTIAEAVRHAVLEIDAKIICNGEIIIYDALSDEDAYYIDERTKTVKIVSL